MGSATSSTDLALSNLALPSSSFTGCGSGTSSLNLGAQKRKTRQRLQGWGRSEPARRALANRDRAEVRCTFSEAQYCHCLQSWCPSSLPRGIPAYQAVILQMTSLLTTLNFLMLSPAAPSDPYRAETAQVLELPATHGSPFTFQECMHTTTSVPHPAQTLEEKVTQYANMGRLINQATFQARTYTHGPASHIQLKPRRRKTSPPARVG